MHVEYLSVFLSGLLAASMHFNSALDYALDLFIYLNYHLKSTFRLYTGYPSFIPIVSKSSLGHTSIKTGVVLFLRMLKSRDDHPV